MKKTLLGGLLACALCLSLWGAALAAPAPALSPSGLYAAPDGGLIIADQLQRALFRQTADGAMTRLAGREGVLDINGLPTGGYNDAEAAAAAFQTPWAVAPYLGGWAVTDTQNHAVRLLRDGAVTTLAGTGHSGNVNGQTINAAFDGPTGLAALPDGSLLVADTGNNTIRKIDANGVVTTFLDAGAGLLEPTGLCYADGAVYVADSGNHRICTVEDGTLSVLAGVCAPEGGYRDGPANLARFAGPQGVAVRDGVVYAADTGNGAVRAIRGGIVTTLLRSGEGSDGMYPVSPRGLALCGDRLAVADVFSGLIFYVPTQLPASDFADVAQDAWYAQAVRTVSAAGWMTGADDRFQPTAPLSRAAGITALYRLAGGYTAATAPIPFSDVSVDDTCARAAVWAFGEGIVAAENSRLLPDQALTRAEFVLWLQRCASASGLSPTAPQSVTLSGFSDESSIPASTADALRWAVDAKLLLGRSDGRLDPNAAATRAEAAVMLARYLTWAS